MGDWFQEKGIRPMLIGSEGETFDSPDYLYELKLDGELAVIHDGKPDFFLIQRRSMMSNPVKIQLEAQRHPACFTAFDILYYEDHAVTDLPLTERKKLLEFVIKEESPRFAVSRWIEGQGIAFYEMAKAQNLEGIVAKRKNSRYYCDKRTKDWIKCKFLKDSDYVVCGYIPKENHMTSLVLGQYRDGQLIYKGQVTLGVGGEAFQKICAVPTLQEPPMDVPKENENAIWVQPQLACTVKYMMKTESGSRCSRACGRINARKNVRRIEMANRLKQEKSPYLMQHGENPVDWYPWCKEAFQKAVQEDKPIFLSIGYSTCHWCHVMAHESFEDQEVADLLNREFISIKVDREERPDIDAVYMSVCQAMTGSGGWPLTIFMTPEQKPFFAGTYFPKHGGYGRFGLMDLLERVADLWKNNREELLRAGNQITAAINQGQVGNGQKPDRRLVERAYSQLAQRFDHKWGGFGAVPKFPTPHNLLFLLRYAEVTQESNARKMAEVTLEDMAKGGIFDHIGGGFSRYSTDEMWLVPHFEKMLYDNALLLIAYTKAYQHTKWECFADTARRTARYILGELTDEEGGCYCGQDADSDGVEGKYYVFTPEEVKMVLGEDDGEEFCRLYDITDSGNFEGKSIPNRIRGSENGWNINDPRLEKLYNYRLNRTKLHKDDKILLSWNAWVMIALVKAGRALEEPSYLDAAIRIHAFIERTMVTENDRLYLRYRDGEAAYVGQLEDYAVYSLALLELYRVTFDAKYLQAAIHRAKQMVELFEDKKNGGYFMTAFDGEQLIARPKETYDGAMPSGNSVAAMVLQTLASLTGEPEWQAAADRQLSFLAGEIGEYPSASCFGVLAMIDALYPHRELVCVSSDGMPSELAEYLKEHPADDLQVLLKTKENAETLAECAPFTKDYPIPGQGTMYFLCENGACKAPVSEFRMLKI